ncbi:MAG: hypothetical protein P8016_12835, partial [Sedimentisphaerales bacterium]
VERIAQALMKYETQDAEDVRIILAVGTIDKPTVGDLLAAEQAKTGETPPEEKPPEPEKTEPKQEQEEKKPAKRKEPERGEEQHQPAK